MVAAGLQPVAVGGRQTDEGGHDGLELRTSLDLAIEELVAVRQIREVSFPS